MYSFFKYQIKLVKLIPLYIGVTYLKAQSAVHKIMCQFYRGEVRNLFNKMINITIRLL